MAARSARTRRSAIQIAKILALLLLALSPRSLLAPTASFNRAMESKRPKVPKNVVRSDPVRVSNLEKQGKSPGPPRPEIFQLVIVGGHPRSPGINPLSFRARVPLSKPDYLNLFSASSPHPLGPPA